MRVHHLNCGTMRPIGGRLVDGRGGFLHRAEMVCHCLLLETYAGLLLIETGPGSPAVQRPDEWLGRGFLRATKPVLDDRQTAASQVKKTRLRRRRRPAYRAHPTRHRPRRWTCRLSANHASRVRRRTSRVRATTRQRRARPVSLGSVRAQPQVEQLPRPGRT